MKRTSFAKMLYNSVFFNWLLKTLVGTLVCNFLYILSLTTGIPWSLRSLWNSSTGQEVEQGRSIAMLYHDALWTLNFKYKFIWCYLVYVLLISIFSSVTKFLFICYTMSSFDVWMTPYVFRKFISWFSLFCFKWLMNDAATVMGPWESAVNI